MKINLYKMSLLPVYSYNLNTLINTIEEIKQLEGTYPSLSKELKVSDINIHATGCASIMDTNIRCDDICDNCIFSEINSSFKRLLKIITDIKVKNKDIK